MNPCLSCKVAPKLGYNYGKETKVVNGEERQFNFEEFTFYCPSCGFKSHTVSDIIAAISGWHTTNTPGNEFYADRWIEQREKQKAQANVGNFRNYGY